MKQQAPTSATSPNSLWARMALSATWMRSLALLTALATVVIVQAFASGWMAQWNDRITSRTWALADSNAQEKRVVVIDIDEKSVQALGPWPWPRDRVAQLLQSLDQQGVNLKIVDILFEGNQAADPALIAALKGGAPTVVGQLFSLRTEPFVRSGTLSGALPLGACPAQAMTAHGFMAPASPIAQAATQVGHITPIVDSDGAVRHIPAIVCHQGQAYPSLTLAALSAATGDTPRIDTTPQLGQSHSQIHIGGFHLPIDEQGRLMVSYQTPRQGFISLSAVDVLNGQIPPQILRGAWALVGSTALGAGDAIPTPQGGAVGGIEVHAHILSAALDARTPYIPNWAPLWPWASAALSMAIMLLALRTVATAGIAIPVATGINLLAIGALHTYWLLVQNQVLAVGLPALFTLAASGCLLVAEILRVRLERERVYNNLSSYLPKGAADKIAFSAPSANVMAERHDASVMFVDLRNFSAYCEGRSPEDAATVLHNFYTTIDRIVTEHGGAVEHMVGDGIMAVWNGSTPCPEHPQKALNAATRIWEEGTQQLPQVASRKTPPLDLGIGVETGQVMVGSFGPAHRRVHTVLGETVTVAARLEALTAELAYPILLGPEIIQRTQALQAKALGDFLLAGLTSPRKVHTLPVKYSEHHLQLVFSVDQEQAFGG
jgi:adenylate cyclase